MKIVYIAGPYTPFAEDMYSFVARERHINMSRECAAWCADNGIGYISPHMNSAHMDAIVPNVQYDFWISMDIQIIERCADAVLFIGDWQRSKGAVREYEYTKRLDKERFEWPHEIDLILKWRGE